MPRPLHIAFFNRSYYPDTSATGQLLTELCRGLTEDHGCRVSVVAGASLLPVSRRDDGSSRTGGWLFQLEMHDGVEVLRASGTRLSKTRFTGRFTNYVSYFLSACYTGLRLDRPDVVVAMTDPPIIGLAGYLAAWRFGSPFVMSYKDVFPEVARLLEDFDSPLVETVLQKVNEFLASRADRVTVLGETMRRRLIEGKGAPADRTVVIPDWIDCDAVYPHEKVNELTRQNGLHDRFVVMHSGNIGLSQGLDTVVEAAAELADIENLDLVFVGEGVKKPALQELANQRALSNVRFLPFAPKERLVESFAGADVFVVSLKAGLAGYIVPSKLYGILAAGRPYVAVVEEDSEVTSITRQYECGLLARLGDPLDIAAKIRRLHEDPALRVRLGDNARKAALEFDRPIQIRRYKQLFEDLSEEPRPLPTPWSKRAFDITLSGLGLVMSSPLWLLVAAAVKLNDGGPVFYGQKRIGKGGRPFKSWKFRSMVVGADRGDTVQQSGVDDLRVTRVGKLLRATAMDELPQLWNIFCGDMSFVGPRALAPSEVEARESGAPAEIDQIPGYRERHRVTPGLTGIAQIFADRDLPRRKKFRLDRLYISRRSFCLDMKLVLLSFWITFRGRWEVRGAKL